MAKVLFLIPLAALLISCSPATNQPKALSKPVAQNSEANQVVGAGDTSECVGLCAASPLWEVSKDGKASGIVHLCNRGKESINLKIAVSDFFVTGSNGARYALSSTRNVAAVDETKKNTALEANDCVDLKVDAANLWQAGLMSASLQNNDREIAKLKAVRYDVPFNLKVDGANPEKLDLQFANGKPTNISLRNDDPYAYTFRWRLQLDEGSDSGVQWVGPKQVVTFPVELKATSYSLVDSGLLRSGSRSGQLYLSYEPDPNLQAFPFAQKRYPIAARLDYWPDERQRILPYVTILGLVMLGIVISLLINYALPTQRERVDIKQKCADLEGRLIGLDKVVESRTLSILRVEKKRLRDELREIWPVFPSAEGELKKLKERVGWLEKRINLTVAAGEHVAASNVERDLSAQEAEDIRSLCRTVLRFVEKSSAAPGEIELHEQYLQRAAQIREGATKPPTKELVDELIRRAKKVLETFGKKPELETALTSLKPDSKFAGLVQRISGELKDLLDQAAVPERADYIRYARAVLRAELLLDFGQLIVMSPDDELRARRRDRSEDLLNALLPGPTFSLHNAGNVVRQAEQNVDSADIIDEIEAIGEQAVKVRIDPPAPLPYQLVTFRLAMTKPGLDTAVAKNEIECKWAIAGKEPSGLEGWSVVEYFLPRRRNWRNWMARLRDRFAFRPTGKVDAGNTPDDGASESDLGAELAVEATLTYYVDGKEKTKKFRPQRPFRVEDGKSYDTNRLALSVGSLLVTVLIVGFGLLAGAQEKIQSLDWVSAIFALLLLGFGADFIKKQLTKTT